MPRLQAVVRVCVTLQLPQFKFYSLLWHVPQAGGISIELKGEKNRAAMVRLPCVKLAESVICDGDF